MAGRTVTLKLDRDRHLKYDLNALAEIGERLDIKVTLEQLGADLLSRPLPLSALRTVIWAGLVWEDEDLTERHVGALINQENFGEVLEAFFSLFGDTFSATRTVVEAAVAGVEIPTTPSPGKPSRPEPIPSG